MDSKVLLEMEVVVEGQKGRSPRLSMELRCEAGVTVLFGPSGAGKSTCLLSIAGLIRPSRGFVRVGDRTLFDSRQGIDIPTPQRHTALVFQSLALFPHYSALENVSYGLPRELSAEERKKKARTWLERMQIPQVADRRPSTFSGGEAQRVALARALASSPRILLLDEPFSAMDTPLRHKLGQEVKHLVDELGMVALLVTHDREDARALSANVVMLEGGRVVGKGRPEELLPKV